MGSCGIVDGEELSETIVGGGDGWGGIGVADGGLLSCVVVAVGGDDGSCPGACLKFACWGVGVGYAVTIGIGFGA